MAILFASCASASAMAEPEISESTFSILPASALRLSVSAPERNISACCLAVSAASIVPSS